VVIAPEWGAISPVVESVRAAAAIVQGWGEASPVKAAAYDQEGAIVPVQVVAVLSGPAAVIDPAGPINVDSAPPDPSAADSSEPVFSAARDSFKAGNYQRALELIDQVVKETPNAPVAHEFRALCLFALKRFDEAATVAYAALSAGPCWNWSTLVGLYPDVDTYTNQLRALEAAVRSKRSSTPPRFLLAYHYLVQGNNEAAGTEFADVVKLEPKGPALGIVCDRVDQSQGIGRAVYVNNVLSLTQEEGPPLTGKIESKDAGKFTFRLMGGGNNAPALTFTR
jgi:tetratricopeptide (TPR) repeat protein